MARFGGIFLGIILFITALTALPGATQGTASGKSGSTAENAKAGDKTAAAKPGDASPLSPEITHRILTELRSRYSVPPQIDIALSTPKAGKTPGYDDIVVTFSGAGHSTSHDFLLSKDRKTLAHLETIDISQDLMSKIDVKDRPVRGNPNAKVTIVNYDDFECPFCSRMHATLSSDLLKDYGDKVRIIYKDYPLVEIHPWAMRAAVDGNCLGQQNTQAYWDFADYVHANQKVVSGKSRSDAFANLDSAAKEQAQKHQLDQDKLLACVQKQDESQVRASMAEGDKLGVDSTPTLFVNGEKFMGVIPEQDFRAALDRALAEAGQQAPASAKK
ncbi:MAG TPA: thioredoxin domain-containing protein [Candidatus Angelobacter sp.]|nr:thioredoxin domain-containing protein [Candidatus Angelobacter sp.]